MSGEGGRIRKGLEVERAGGVAFILGNNELLGNDLSSDAHFIPSTQVSYHNVLKLIHYINSSSNPMASGTTDNTGNPFKSLTDKTGNPAIPFAIGAGHFNPVKAVDPALVNYTS
ncbi:Subtilisin-like protease [Arachis hypogaea]|nr:Subtilisin-like protease [Arachis hypogaea]